MSDTERPWESEPDFKAFEAFGFPYFIIRHPELKNLCGYVGVPPGHPLHGVGMTDEAACLHEILKMRDGDIELDKESMLTIMEVVLGGELKPTPTHAFEVHRGVTFAGKLAEEVTGRAYASHWFFGFDCAHHGDYVPGTEELHREIQELIPDLPDLTFVMQGTYRTMEYVESEVKKLAMQLSLLVPTQETNPDPGSEEEKNTTST